MAEFKGIQLKRSTTTGVAPEAAQLVEGELAINLADKKLYSKSSSGVFQVLGGIDDNTIAYAKLSTAAKNSINTQVADYLGTVAMQDANAVAITGGTITGITDLTVADGGTGVSTIPANAVVVGNGTSPVQSVAPGTTGNVLTSNGTAWTSAAPVTFGWNVTYVNISKSDDTSYTLPLNCIGVYIWCETYGGGNNGGIGKVSIKNSGGTELGYVYVGGTNIGSGADGGSGMRDGVGTFVPVPSTATTLDLSTVTNDVNSSWVIQAYVTK